jgi:hypothetical protein
MFLFRSIVKRHAMTGSGLGRYAETGQPPGSGGDGWGPAFRSLIHDSRSAIKKNLSGDALCHSLASIKCGIKLGCVRHVQDFLRADNREACGL